MESLPYVTFVDLASHPVFLPMLELMANGSLLPSLLNFAARVVDLKQVVKMLASRQAFAHANSQIVDNGTPSVALLRKVKIRLTGHWRLDAENLELLQSLDFGGLAVVGM